MKTTHFSGAAFTLFICTIFIMAYTAITSMEGRQTSLSAILPPGTREFIKGLFFNYMNG